MSIHDLFQQLAIGDEDPDLNRAHLNESYSSFCKTSEVHFREDDHAVVCKVTVRELLRSNTGQKRPCPDKVDLAQKPFLQVGQPERRPLFAKTKRHEGGT